MPLPKEYKWEYSQDTATDMSMTCFIPDTDIWYIQTPVPVIGVKPMKYKRHTNIHKRTQS